MQPFSRKTYAKIEASVHAMPNYWDLVALSLVFIIIILLGWSAKEMVGQYQLGQALPIDLHPSSLPYYALRTVLRMFIALFFSLLFTFIFGTWAAKSHRAERIIIPLIDILQSVPVLGFLSISVVLFIALFRGSLLGPECAAIFAIFVSQVWNMTLSFYQSLRMVPNDLREASAMFHLSAWQQFWRIEVPFAMPGLLWNTMMSMSASWVFLVASEAITVSHHIITLPGIGSYIWLAIKETDLAAIGYVILTMFLVIVFYDQLLFRPLVAWAEKFKAETTASEIEPSSWLLNLFQRTQFFRYLGHLLSGFGDAVVNMKLLRQRNGKDISQTKSILRRFAGVGSDILLFMGILSVAIFLLRYLLTTVTASDVYHVVYLGFITSIRVMVMIVLSSIIWVPVGVWIGLSAKSSQYVQPIIQFFAAFPANLLFPLVVIVIVKFNLNVNIWVSPLMILGAQWYILFNVIAGMIALPKNFHQAVGTLNVRGWLWWKRFILPGIFPYYITGAITAAGGAWNISIIAEAVNWGNTQLRATGLGAYITEVYLQGDFPRLTLGIVIMSLYVLTFNRLLWRPLYNLADQRYRIT